MQNRMHAKEEEFLLQKVPLPGIVPFRSGPIQRTFQCYSHVVETPGVATETGSKTPVGEMKRVSSQ